MSARLVDRRAHTSVVGALLFATLLAGSVSSAAEVDPGVEVLESARARAEARDYSGVLRVEWYDGDQALRARVLVRHEGDVLEMGDERRAIVAGTDGVVAGDQVWTMGAATLAVRRGPSASEKYRIQVGARVVLGGRPAQLLEARRRSDGTVAQRMLIDDATGLVVQREIYERDGTLVQSLAFERLWEDPDVAGLTVADATPSASRGDGATVTPVEDLRAPLRDPGGVGDGFELVGRWTLPGGVAQPLYSDGLIGVSVFEQPGRLDWDALPSGGQSTSVAGHPAVRYALPTGPAVIWERDGVVFTAVGAAASHELAAIGAGVSSPPGGNAVVRFARFVLDPFRL
jgi:hypothetical protein